MEQLVRAMLQDLEGPLGVDVSLRLALGYVSGPEVFRGCVCSALAEAETSIAEGRGLESYAALRQIDALLAKNVDWGVAKPEDRKVAALEKFARGEQACSRANRRIKWYKRRPSRLPEMVANAIGYAQLLVQEILGPLDEVAKAEMLDRATHGPGATWAVGQRESGNNSFHKLDPSYVHSCTRGAIPRLVEYGTRNPYWINFLCGNKASYEIVEGNRVTTVPKKWNCDRTIGVEPSLNVFLQLGVGGYIASKLKPYGVTLSDQRPNQAAAAAGSLKGDTVTMDLSNASDTISIEAVRLLLPGEWFIHLDELRSPAYQVGKKGAWQEYEKFSSMGNGFTFPLESLLFYAVLRGCVSETYDDPRLIRVFGDDLVVPTGSALLVIEVLEFLGFTINREKSHFFGWFRESCGTDYYYGIDVRPTYVDSCPTDDASVYNLYNRLRAQCIWDVENTLSFLKTLAKDSEVPSDLGLTELGKAGWTPGISLRYETGFIGDPPPPSGECSSVMSPYYTYSELTYRFASCKVWPFHDQTVYFAFLLGARVDRPTDNRRKVFYRRESFTFTWIPVSDVRDAVWRRRVKALGYYTNRS